MIVHRLGVVPWTDALDLQLAARDRVLAGGPDELFLLEHEPVVTLGRRGGVVDGAALAALGTPVVHADRGGLATWHGPGQLVGYPIVHLERLGRGIPHLVAWLGEAMAATARGLGAGGAAFDEARPGVYREGRKLGSIGLHVHRQVTTHGVALNVDCALDGFGAIEPCGEALLVVTSVAREVGRPLAVGRAADLMLRELGIAVGGRQATPAPRS